MGINTILLHILLILVISNGSFQLKTRDRNPLEIEYQKNNELLFRSKIGSQDLKTEALVCKMRTESHQTQLLINLNKEGKIIFSDTLWIEMQEEPFIELRKINDDQTDDLAIEYLRPGRGGNNISMIYLFDKDNLCLKRIPNSISFPNLIYDSELKFISSFRFYGGDAVQMDFLKIQNDTLVSKYEVIREVQNVYLNKLENGKWIEVGERIIDEDIIIPEILQLEPEIKIKDNK